MKTIQVPTREIVSIDAQLLFDQVQKRMGKVPNLYATVGYSAVALKALLTLNDILSHSKFTATEREVISLAVSEVNNCNYCIAAHTMTGKMKGLSEEDVTAARYGRAANPKLNTVAQLAKSIAANKGDADKDLLEDFFAAGYQASDLMELVGLIIAITFTNYVYVLTGVPIDFPQPSLV
ncbi:MAG: carboxymuconolactone decarboxylase family protein [Chitinophagaceae bacterium]